MFKWFQLSSLRTRLLLLISAMIAFVSISVYLYLPHRFQAQAMQVVDHTTNGLVQMVGYSLLPAVYFEDTEGIEEILSSTARNKDVKYIIVTDVDKNLLASHFTSDTTEWSHILSDTACVNHVAYHRDTFRKHMDLRYDDALIGSLYMGFSLDKIRAKVDESRRTIAVVILLIFFTGILGVISISRLITVPLRRMLITVKDISGGDLSQRVKISSRDEIGVLVDAFNGMVDNLQNAQKELENANQTLDSRVKERTRELREKITEIKLTTEALQESEEKFRLISDQSVMGIFIVQDSLFKYVNQALCDIVEYSADDMHTWGQNECFKTLFHREDEKKFIEYAKRHEEQAVLTNFCCRITVKSGKTKWIELYSRSITFAGKSAILAAVIDTTERKAAEEEVRKFKTLADQALYGVAIADMNGELLYVNKALADMHGYDPSELIAQDLKALFNKEQLAYVEELNDELHKEGFYLAKDIPHSKKDGSTFPTLMTATAIRTENKATSLLAISVVDISELKQAEKEKEDLQNRLRQAQKMEAIGTLAGGIAHDFNNILMALLGYADMALGDIPKGAPVREDIEAVVKAGNRAADLVRQILMFSRQTEQTPKPMQLKPVVMEALTLLRASLPTTIKINHSFRDDCGEIMADPTQIHQVIMNLCTNAHHAMQEKGGVLTITGESVEVDSETFKQHPDLQPGSYIKLTVSDTGSGMDHKTMERAFEPFFTTKEVGKGTGMGLSTVHGIVTSYNGIISVDSELGKGTTFSIYLPEVKHEISDTVLESESLPQGHESILLVDDEEPLANLYKKMLERMGYSVTVRTSSVEALEAFQAKPDKYDLIITDQTMPNLTGIEFAKKILAIRPDMPIILATGFSEQTTPERARQIGIRDFLMKPLVAQEIGKAMRRALDDSKERG